jgi:uncharacterized protein (UPF0332 family)
MSGALAARSYFGKAQAALSAARLLLQAGDADGACNRAYYVMFDAAHAALFSIDAENVASPIKTHSGLLARFGQRIVKAEFLDAEHGGDLNKVQALRQLADYSGDPIAPERAAWAVERAEHFVAAVRTVFSL